MKNDGALLLISVVQRYAQSQQRLVRELHTTLYRKMRMSSPIMDPVAIEWSLDRFDQIGSVSVRSSVKYHSIGHRKAQSSGEISGDV